MPYGLDTRSIGSLPMWRIRCQRSIGQSWPRRQPSLELIQAHYSRVTALIIADGSVAWNVLWRSSRMLFNWQPRDRATLVLCMLPISAVRRFEIPVSQVVTCDHSFNRVPCFRH